MLKEIRKKNKGFTLIEILVAVLIVGILAAIAVPTYLRPVERSRTSDPINTLKTIAKTEQVYRLRAGEYTNQAQELDLQVKDYPAGNTVAGDTFEGQYYTYKLYGEEEPVATAGRKTTDEADFYELSVDYSTGEIFCRPAEHRICMDLGLEAGQPHGQPVYDTGNLQNWVLEDYLSFTIDVLSKQWNRDCGRNLNCLKDIVDGMCTDNGTGNCLNILNRKITGKDGNQYYWMINDKNRLVLSVNTYAQSSFYAHIAFYPNSNRIDISGYGNAPTLIALGEKYGLQRVPSNFTYYLIQPS